MLTVQLLPVSALADEFEIDGERHDTFTYEQQDVSGEIPELRGEYEKHFSLSDGTYSAVVYPYPVHYDSNGTWQEIDNTLRSGSETYMVAAESGVELAELLPAGADAQAESNRSNKSAISRAIKRFAICRPSACNDDIII